MFAGIFWGSAMLNVFHISDLHYTSDITGHVRDAAVSSVTAMLNLAAELKAQGILGRDLCVCITGDLVQTGAAKPDGQLSDFQAVNEDFLVPLMATLDIDAKSVYIVPGNHEMDRDAVAPDARISGGNLASKKPCEGDLHADLCTKLSHYFDFIEHYGYQSVTRSSPRMAMFDRSGQYIVCINSLVGSYSLPGTQDKGELFLLPSEMGGALAAIPNFSIVLTHHPFSWFTDECGVDLKSSLSERRCRLMMGHIHSQGVDWLDTAGGGMAIIQAGASAERNKGNKVAVAWYPPSDSAAVRHFTYNQTLGRYDRTETSATRVVPNSAQAFFERSEAFFDPDLIKLARTGAFTDCGKELTAALGQDPSKYIVPDLVIYSADEFSGKRVKVDSFHSNNNHKVISGDELSGKTSLIYYAAMKANESIGNTKIHLVIDYRGLSAGRDIHDTVIKKIQSFGLTKSQAEYILNIGLLEIWFDNFDSDDASSLAKFTKFFEEFKLNWNVAVRGGQHFMPSRAPTAFPKDGISYYRMAEITLPTALRMIDVHDNGKIQERPRAVVERVFRSINNLRAPRTVFYVNNLVDLFLSDGSVEPLNRYLLIENLLSEKIREAHKLHLPNQAVDMEMLDTFIGSIAYFLL
jgi:predicted MPP superfamily phosphohydrolase